MTLYDTHVLVRLPSGGVSQYTSLWLEVSSLFSRERDASDEFKFIIISTTLPLHTQRVGIDINR